MRNEFTTSKTKTEMEFDKSIPFIFIDKIQIQQVLLNLMQNSIEAMQQSRVKDKYIHIKTTILQPDYIEITISDSGPGFTKDLIHKVFMPFFTTKAHGRGMGLAICRSIIEAHGGAFTIEPNTYGKSWIQFTLPISI
jgi:two-component system sensor kinase FixL